jgi:hypothetical protein
VNESKKWLLPCGKPECIGWLLFPKRTILRDLDSNLFGVGSAVNSFSFFLRIASGANNLKVFNPFGINKINYRNNPK